MTTHATARQPFAALNESRLRELTSIKNRQNAITASLSSPGKANVSTPDKPGSSLKKRFAPSNFDDDFDSENIDPAIFSSPSKRSKAFDGTPGKASKFNLTDAFAPSSKPFAFTSTPGTNTKRPSTLSLSVPNTTNVTPISASRGSPKHKRVGILSKRRNSSSPFRRVDPPPFGRSRNAASSLPFSIDAALSGTIPNYAPKTTFEDKAVPTLEEAVPQSWFFDIYVDTPEEEAENLMEHSASVLDISSDDDAETKRQNELRERGKENIPPEWNVAASSGSVANAGSASDAEIATEPLKKSLRARKAASPDDMMDDGVRSPLGDLPAKDYYPEGLDEKSIAVVVDSSGADKENGEAQPTTEDGEQGVTVWIDEAGDDEAQPPQSSS